MKERDYIEWLRGVLSSSYVGDDAAVIDIGGEQLLFTTDLLVEGTHFARDTEPRLVGRKAVAASLSDIAAMGGSPVCVVLSVCMKRGCGEEPARELFLGASEVVDEFDIEIVGGDTTSSRNAFTVCVAALGRPGPGGPVTRSGARDGDSILVTGSLGGSIRGKHLRFVPRITEAEAILKKARPSAMIDVSDGLGCDLGHLVEESGVGAVLYEDAVPVSDDAKALSEEDGRSPLDHALRDGEDYELLLTAPVEAAAKIAALNLDCDITLIGQMGGDGIRLADPTGKERPLDPGGYEHEW